jgi:hypothetical protein
MKSFLRRTRSRLTQPLGSDIPPLLRSQHDSILQAMHAEAARTAKNPLNRYGAKYFSQTDEDGITLEIVRRLGITEGTFAELGVGDGLENNTLILLAMGWRGFWIGGEELAFNHRLNPKRLTYFKSWVSLDNILPLIRQGYESVSASEIDVLSLDLDGNDFYFAREILVAGIRPKLFIFEYNAKFPPPIKWTIGYDAKHVWDGTDYQGASLALFCDLLAEFSYSLVCCNAATGVNAFFVKNEYLSEFGDVPKDVADIFIGCRYHLYGRWGHRPSGKTIERMLNDEMIELCRSPTSAEQRPARHVPETVSVTRD